MRPLICQQSSASVLLEDSFKERLGEICGMMLQCRKSLPICWAIDMHSCRVSGEFCFPKSFKGGPSDVVIAWGPIRSWFHFLRQVFRPATKG